MAVVLCVIPLVESNINSGERTTHHKDTICVKMEYSRVPMAGEEIFIHNKMERRFLDPKVESVQHLPAGYITQNNGVVDAEVKCTEYDCSGYLGGYEALKKEWAYMSCF